MGGQGFESPHLHSDEVPTRTGIFFPRSGFFCVWGWLETRKQYTISPRRTAKGAKERRRLIEIDEEDYSNS